MPGAAGWELSAEVPERVVLKLTYCLYCLGAIGLFRTWRSRLVARTDRCRMGTIAILPYGIGSLLDAFELENVQLAANGAGPLTTRGMNSSDEITRKPGNCLGGADQFDVNEAITNVSTVRASFGACCKGLCLPTSLDDLNRIESVCVPDSRTIGRPTDDAPTVRRERHTCDPGLVATQHCEFGATGHVPNTNLEFGCSGDALSIWRERHASHTAPMATQYCQLSSAGRIPHTSRLVVRPTDNCAHRPARTPCF